MEVDFRFASYVSLIQYTVHWLQLIHIVGWGARDPERGKAEWGQALFVGWNSIKPGLVLSLECTSAPGLWGWVLDFVMLMLVSARVGVVVGVELGNSNMNYIGGGTGAITVALYGMVMQVWNFTCRWTWWKHPLIMTSDGRGYLVKDNLRTDITW